MTDASSPDSPEIASPDVPGVRLRPFAAEDYPARVAISNRCLPDNPTTEESVRHGDSLWEDRYFRLRLVAEGDGAGIVGWGLVRHSPWTFHPDRYTMAINVDPAHQRRGIGTLLHDAFLAALRDRGAELVRAEAQESATSGVDFLLHRGYREVSRQWESRLDVGAFDFAPFSGAFERVADQGILLTTLAAEGAKDEPVRRAVYHLAIAGSEGEPELDPITPMSFEQFVGDELDAPNALPDAFFLARSGDRYVGLSSLNRNLALPGVMGVGFTCALPEFRGRGIAMALKLKGVAYARDHGYHEIRTDNDSTNRPMLRINEALGFARRPAWVRFQRDLR